MARREEGEYMDVLNRRASPQAIERGASPPPPAAARAGENWLKLLCRGTRFSLVLLVLLGAAGCGDDDGCDCPAAGTIDCAHRGTGIKASSNPWPENTVPSFQQAEVEGASMVELDVQHSSDGVLVVIHDDTVDRTTDATGCVGDLDVAALQALDAAAGTSLAGTGVVLPTFAEALAAITVDVNVEIKVTESSACPAADRPALAADVVAALAADAAPRRIVVSSFDLEVLQAVQALDPDLDLGLLTMSPSDASVAAAEGFASVNVIGGIYEAAELAALSTTWGLEVAVWTIDDPAEQQALLEAGVDMIITNAPDGLETTRTAVCAARCGP
jgi:glycerophosphoryl diester phosphodiesterase